MGFHPLQQIASLSNFGDLLGRSRWKLPEFFDPGHEIICGAIGMGKSYWVLHKIIKSFLYDRPCCYIDPKGDTYRALLAFLATTEQGRALWERYRHRILLFNPVSASDYVLGFNAIEPLQPFPNAHPDPVALLANSIVSHIRRQSGYEIGEANRMQNIMSAAIGLLAQGGRGQLSLAELPLLFTPTHAYGEGGKRYAEPINPLVAHQIGGRIDQTTEHGGLTPEQACLADRAAHDQSQHVAPVLVERQKAVREHEADTATVIRQDPQ